MVGVFLCLTNVPCKGKMVRDWQVLPAQYTSPIQPSCCSSFGSQGPHVHHAIGQYIYIYIYIFCLRGAELLCAA